MATVPCERVEPAPAWPVDQGALAECADEILARVSAARSPVLMVGVEVRRYALEEPMAQFAYRLGMPVVTSFLGRGLMNSTRAPAVGTYLGVAGDREITAMVEDADLLLLFGVILSDTNFGVSARQIDMRRAIHALDRQVRVGHHVYPGLPIADLAQALVARCAGAGRSRESRPRDADYPRGMPADDHPVSPDDIAAAVNDLMAEHGPLPLTSDVGDCLFTAMDMVQTDLAAPGYYAGMGFGVPAGLGAQAATGRRPLVLVGDGAFQMTGWELGNCRRYGWDPIVLLFNNRSWEMLRVFQPESRFNDLDDWRFAELAPHLGGEGVRVATRAGLRRALADAVSRRGRFQLIEVMLARGAVSRTLGRFVEGVARMRGRHSADPRP
jgi:indolepyruvate decarboxylase